MNKRIKKKLVKRKEKICCKYLICGIICELKVTPFDYDRCYCRQNLKGFKKCNLYETEN